MRAIVPLGVLAAALVAGGSASGGQPPPIGQTGLIAVVRPGDHLCAGGTPGSLEPPFPAIACPAPASCLTGLTGPPKKKPKPIACPKPRADSVYLVSKDGLSTRNLGAGTEPAWSADGTELVYVDRGFIVLQHVSGVPPRDVIVALSASDGRSTLETPSWAPDGRTIIFSAVATSSLFGISTSQENLYAVDVATRDVRLVAEPLPNELIKWATFSPDGTQIAYALWGMDRGVWVMNADGTDAHEVTPVTGYPYGVAWSPDGGTLVFGIANGLIDAMDGDGIYTVNPDGSDLKRIVEIDRTNATLAVTQDPPRWLPTSRRVGFRAAAQGQPAAAYTAQPDGRDVRLALREPWSVLQPVWQP